MSGPLPTPTDNPATLHYRHVRAVTGVIGMLAGVALFALIQYLRAATAAALLAKGCPTPATVLPTSTLQATYDLIIPVGVPLFIVVMGVQLFSPRAFGQVVASVRTLLPWAKAA